MIDDPLSHFSTFCTRFSLEKFVLELPRGPMLTTRARARHDLRAAVRPGDESEIEGLVDDWFSDETQAALRAMVARLKAKKG